MAIPSQVACAEAHGGFYLCWNNCPYECPEGNNRCECCTKRCPCCMADCAKCAEIDCAMRKED